jgi:Protein of unknown function (DUF1769)
MKVRGIRYADSTTYEPFEGFCAGCILPINNGNEAPGKSLVVDFETKHFVGSVLLRLKGVPPIPASRSDEGTRSHNYFAGKKRTFQAVVKGRFKTEGIRMDDSVTGQVFSSRAGKLPSAWIVKSIISCISLLAPQLDVQLDGRNPRFLTPLVATAQAVLVKDLAHLQNRSDYTQSALLSDAESTERMKSFQYYPGSTDMESDLTEPAASDPTSVVKGLISPYEESKTKSVGSLMRQRKKVFNHLAATRHSSNSDAPVFDTGREYTFEFYQHLLAFDDVNDMMLSGPFGKVGLAQPLNGQPLKFYAAFRKHEEAASRPVELEPLWSFDIWHDAFFPLSSASIEQESEITPSV